MTQRTATDPEKNKFIGVMIAKLGTHYYRPDFGPEQVKHMVLDFIEDLSDFAISDIDEAIKAYRRDPKNKFFPSPGALHALAAEARKERRAAETARPLQPQFGDCRPLMWWCKSPFLWEPHWREADIPEDQQAGFRRRLAANRAAGLVGWQDGDFYGLARKHRRPTHHQAAE